MHPQLFKLALTLAIGGALLGGCADSSRSGAAQAKGDMVEVANDDAAMNAALAKGQATLPQFRAALGAPKPSQKNFAVYARFTENGRNEYLWLEPVTLQGGDFSGVVNNEPGLLKQVKLGDTVTVSAKDVGDWMFVEDGKLVGGQTSRVLRDQLSDAERAELDKSVPYKFE